MKHLNISKLFRSNYLIGASSIYVLSSFLLKGINFLTTPIFTRILSLEEYGNVSSAITLTSFFAIFLCCQVSGSVNTAKVEFKNERFNAFIFNLSLLSILSALMIGSLLLAFGKSITAFMELRPIFIVPVVVSSFGTCLLNLYSTYIVATKQPKKKAYFSIAYSLLVVSISLLAVLWSSSNKDLARIFAIALANAIISIYILSSIKKRNTSAFDRKQFKIDSKYALLITLPLIPHLFANLINSQADRAFIIRMLGSDSLAFYSVAYSLGMAFLAFTDACLMAWTPWYFEKTKQRNSESSVKIASTIVFVLLSLLFSIMILLAPEALALVAPPTYTPARSCVIAIAFGVFFQTLYRFPMGYETCMKNTRYTALCTGLTAGINIALNFLLIPRYGILGAAIATAVSYIVLFLSHDFVARRIIGGFNISFRNYLWPTCIVIMSTIISFFALDILLVRSLTLAAVCFLCVTSVFILYNKTKKI